MPFEITNNWKKIVKKNPGFTLIELVIVISVIGMTAGVLMNVINGQRQREYAQDGVFRSNLDLTVKTIETYYTAERSYPDQGGANQNPTAGADSTTLAFYLEIWPAGLVYNENGADFSIHVRKATNTDYFKYSSIWKEIRECADGTDIGSVTDCD